MPTHARIAAFIPFAPGSARSGGTRRRLVAGAVLATSLTALTAACASSPNAGALASTNPTASSAAPSASPTSTSATSGSAEYPPGTPLASNGTTTVAIGTEQVAFPTTVTDATWAPNGSRIAFIDGSGNVATALPNGTSLIELTTAKPGVTRSAPAWSGTRVVFTETAGGVSNVESVGIDGYTRANVQNAPLIQGQEADADGAYPTQSGITEIDSGESSFSSAPATWGTDTAYQYQSANGPEVVVEDTTQRTPDIFEVGAGTDPMMSPDGSRIVFVGTDGQIDVAADADHAAVSALTSGITGATDPVWSADGQTVTFDTPAGFETVSAASAGAPHQPRALALPLTSGNVTVDYLLGTPIHVESIYKRRPGSRRHCDHAEPLRDRTELLRRAEPRARHGNHAGQLGGAPGRGRLGRPGALHLGRRPRLAHRG